MASGTFSQIYIQVVFAVRGRRSLILDSWEDELFKYITGIVQGQGQKLIAINGMPDHVHILIGMKPSCCLSDLVRDIKRSSSVYIREKGFVKSRFHWQSGYGAFSYSQSALGNVIRYIENQKKHHRAKSFRKEYIAFLKKYGIEFKEEYLFDFLD